MELNVHNVIATESALDKKEGRGRQNPGQQRPKGGFAAALGRAAGQRPATPGEARRDGFAPDVRPGRTETSQPTPYMLHRHVGWVNGALARLYNIGINKQ